MVNVDIISGFLGAGKTTFANMLLHHYQDLGRRCVYIVNEFGQTTLDANIIKADGFEAIEIEGGCICCTLKDDIAASLENVIDSLFPDNIVFEPSGIFIFDNFFEMLIAPPLRHRCTVGLVITVVDSVNFTASKAVYGSFIYNQIKNAPIILLSKLEKNSEAADELICDIKNINPDAFVISKIWEDWSGEDFDSLLGTYIHPANVHNSHHHNELESVTITPGIKFTEEITERFFNLCISGAFGSLFRVKGIVAADDGGLSLINLAGRDLNIAKFKGAADCTLTFIGRSVNERKVREFLM